MGAVSAYIQVRLQTKNPIEIGDFVSEFTSVASQYDKFIRERYPDLTSEAHIYVKQVRRGSIIVELLPFVPLLIMGGAEMAIHLEHINALNEFVRTYGGKLKKYFRKGGSVQDASRSDLKDFMGSVAAIANDPNGKAALEAVVYEDRKKRVSAAIKFTTKEAIELLSKLKI